MKRKAYKPRNSLNRKISAEDSPWTRQALARYGRKVPLQVWNVQRLRERWIKTHNADNTMFFSEVEREQFLSMFLVPVINLDEKFFEEMAKAIRICKNSMEEYPDKTLIKLSDPSLWLATPPHTVEQIKKRIGYVGTSVSLRRLLNLLNVPHTKSKGGRPRKTRHG